MLGAVGVVLALIAVDIVLVNGIQPAQAHPVTQVVKISGAPVVQPTVDLTVSPGIKPGADGKLHDAFSVTNFYVHAGQPIKLVINNTDDAAHSIVAPGAGVSIMVKPGTHTYTLIVRKAGRFSMVLRDAVRSLFDGARRLHARLHHRQLNHRRHPEWETPDAAGAPP